VEFGGVADTIEAAVAAGAFPGAVILVGRGDEVAYLRSFGRRTFESDAAPMACDTVFDLSSLTKPLATTTAVMMLVRDGRLALDDRVARYLPNFAVHGKTGVTVQQLLSHSSGLAAWRPYYKDILRAQRQGRPNFLGTRGAREQIYESIHRERLEYAPGAKSVYSDLGFLVLGELVELMTQSSLDRVCLDRVFRPLGLKSIGFVDLSRLRLQKVLPVPERIAPTERCTWRQRTLCGEVHDDNAHAAGGVCGHAGLFASAEDVHGIVSRLVACYRGDGDFVPSRIVRRVWSRDESVPGSTWALGWDTPAAEGSTAGERVSRNAVGHLGFTGTSVWIDLERGAHVILLTNRVHPHRSNEKIRQARPRVHDAVWAALDA